jgi:prolipoprotein diacylglyceryl transferase
LGGFVPDLKKGVSMHPILYEIFGYPIRTYGLAMAMAFVVNIMLTYRRAPLEGQDRDVTLNTCLWIVIGTLVGGRLLFAITQWEDFVTDPKRLYAFWEGGLVFYGGFIGSYIAAIGYMLWINLTQKNRRAFAGMLVTLTFIFGYALSGVRVLQGNAIPDTNWVMFWNYGLHHSVGFLLAFATTYIFFIWKTRSEEREYRILPILDLLSPYVGLGLAIHRGFGCFLNGCCYGRPTEMPWGVRFPLEHAGTRFYGIAAHLHPTQLYEAANGLIIFFALLWFRKRRKGEGETTAALLMIYAFNRYLIEFVRGDTLRGDLGEPLSAGFFLVCFAIVVAALAAYLTFVRRMGIAKGIAQADKPVKVYGIFFAVIAAFLLNLFFGELLRTVPTLATIGPISTSQFLGYGTFIVGFIIFVTARYLGRRGKPLS